MGQLDRLEGLGEGADLVDLHQDAVADAGLDAAGELLGVGDEEVVADELHAAAEALGEELPALPVVLAHAVFDGDDGVAVAEPFEVVDHLNRGQRAALAGEAVDLGLGIPELRGGAVEGEAEVAARLVAGCDDGLDDDGERSLVVGQVGGKAALVAHAGGEAAGLEHLLEGVEDLGAGAEPFGEGGEAAGDDHELLDVHRGVGVGAAVEDVHERHGERAGERATEVAVERHAELVGGGVCRGHRDAQDRVGAQLVLIVGAVEIAEDLVELHLVCSGETDDGGGEELFDVADGLEHALAEEALLVAVTELNGLALARGGARGDGRAAGRTGEEGDIDFNGGVATGVEDFARLHFDDGHVGVSGERGTTGGRGAALGRDTRLKPMGCSSPAGVAP